jgi:hypothetical protein
VNFLICLRQIPVRYLTIDQDRFFPHPYLLIHNQPPIQRYTTYAIRGQSIVKQIKCVYAIEYRRISTYELSTNEQFVFTNIARTNKVIPDLFNEHRTPSLQTF